MRILGLLVIPVLIAGCSQDAPPEKTVFDPQVQALNKSRETQAVIEAGADKTRQAVEQQEERPASTGY
jgi:hypothetical protein